MSLDSVGNADPDEPDQRLEIEIDLPAGDPIGSIVWLHGLGQDASVMRGISEAIGLTGVRSVYVSAPYRMIGMVRTTPVRAWFMQKITRMDEGDLTTLNDAKSQLREIVDAESAVVGADRVVIAGFSQGAAMATSVALHHPERLACLALYAPFIVREDLADATRSDANAQLPVWIGHGRRDWTVPIKMGRAVRNILHGWGHPVTWQSYPGIHEPFPDAGPDLRRFLDENLIAPGAVA